MSISSSNSARRWPTGVRAWGDFQVAKVPFLADASTGVGRPLAEPVSFRADVRSGSTGLGRLLVEPVSFGLVRSRRYARLRRQRHPRLGRGCWISHDGTRKCPGLLGEAFTVRVTDEGVPVALDPEGLEQAQGGAAKKTASRASGRSAVRSLP